MNVRTEGDRRVGCPRGAEVSNLETNLDIRLLRTFASKNVVSFGFQLIIKLYITSTGLPLLKSSSFGSGLCQLKQPYQSRCFVT